MLHRPTIAAVAVCGLSAAQTAQAGLKLFSAGWHVESQGNDGFVEFETGGIGALRIRFIPEPHGWMTLVAGISLVALGTRLRRR